MLAPSDDILRLRLDPHARPLPDPVRQPQEAGRALVRALRAMTEMSSEEIAERGRANGLRYLTAFQVDSYTGAEPTLSCTVDVLALLLGLVGVEGVAVVARLPLGD